MSYFSKLSDISPRPWWILCGWWKAETDEPTDAFDSYGFRIFGLEFAVNIVNEKRIDQYGCPNCGNPAPSDAWGESYTFNGKKYPRYENMKTSMWAAIEFGGNPQDWDETHYCELCEEEYDFSNSSY